MKNRIKNCSKLSVAIAAAMGLAGQAHAAVDAEAGTGAPTFAKEYGTASVNLTNAGDRLDVTFKAAAASDISDSEYFAVVTLNNGVKFAATPSLKCASAMFGTTAGGAVTSQTISGTIVSGGNGSNFAVFQFKTGNKSAAIAKVSGIKARECSMSAATYSVSGTTDKTITIAFKDKDAFGNLATVKTLSNKPFIKFSRSQTPKVTTATVTIDVAAASKKFANNKTTAQLGKVEYNTAANVLVSAGNASGHLSSFASATNTTVTLSGAPLAAGIAFSTANKGIFLASDTACTTPKKSSFASKSGNSVTFTGVAPSDLNAGLYACMTVDGNTILTQGTVTITVKPQMKNTKYDVLGVSNATVAKFQKNGDSANAFVVSPPGAAVATFLRVINKSNISGKVFVTLYDQDGNTLGTAGADLGTINPNQTKVFNSQDIAQAVGVSTWTGRARAVFDAETPDIAVINLNRTAGVIVNNSPVQE